MARWLVIAAVVLLWTAPGAGAHGPCGCLVPARAAPGATVTIASPTIRVVVNPRPADLIIAPRRLAAGYRPAAPTVTVVDRRAPKRRLRFRVPPLPAGVYLVLIFDGDEGGAHSTWEYLRVVHGARRPARPRERPDDRRLTWVAAGIAMLGVAELLRRRRRA